MRKRGVAQFGSAPLWGSGGRGFKSRRSDYLSSSFKSDLLKMFWECHDPTQKNGQGNDIGSQYRSAIYYKNQNNIKTILASKKEFQTELSKKNLGLIETEIKMIDSYFYAEQYHQQYLASVGSRQYCSASPTKVKLGVFTGSNYKLEDHIWENFNWEVDKCVLRSDNNPIKNNI